MKKEKTSFERLPRLRQQQVRWWVFEHWYTYKNSNKVKPISRRTTVLLGASILAAALLVWLRWIPVGAFVTLLLVVAAVACYEPVMIIVTYVSSPIPAQIQYEMITECLEKRLILKLNWSFTVDHRDLCLYVDYLSLVLKQSDELAEK